MLLLLGRSSYLAQAVLTPLRSVPELAKYTIRETRVKREFTEEKAAEQGM